MATTSSVICDWLDVTVPPESETPKSVLDLVLPLATDVRKDEKRDRTVVTFGGGSLHIDKKNNLSRISASGQVMTALRSFKLLNSFLDSIGSSPHKVTRIDAAYDTDEDFPAVYKRLRRKYRNEKPKLTRKSLNVTCMSSFRESDGKETGSFYAGHRSKAQVTAKAYDKQHEINCKNPKQNYPFPYTRYELTVRGDMSPSLRDVAEPDRIFWHYMSPAFLRLPSGLVVEPWESGWGGSWKSDPVVSDPVRRLKGLVENSSVLDEMLRVADEISSKEGRTYLARLLSNRLGKSLPILDE